MFVMIENKGQIMNKALTLLGGSTKRDSTDKIGFFGSGNKYALAHLLRNDIHFAIFSGTRHIKITKKPINMGSHVFDVAVIDGHESDITTETGPQWQRWYVFREFLSNAIDEGECNLQIIDVPEGREGYTRIFLDAKDYGDIYNNKHHYFKLWSEPNTSSVVQKPNKSYCNFYPVTNEKHGRIFRKGILVSQHKLPSLYDYDLTHLEINEQREIRSTSSAEYGISSGIKNLTDKSVIRNILSNGNRIDLLESQLCSQYFEPMSKEWKEVITEEEGIVVNCFYAGKMIEKYAKIIPVWEWMYETLREDKDFNFSIPDKKIIHSRPYKGLVPKKTLMGMLERLGKPVTDVMIGDFNCGDSVIIEDDIYYLSSTKNWTEVDDPIVFLKYAFMEMSIASFIQHLFINNLLKP